jgi:hypothetical protein
MNWTQRFANMGYTNYYKPQERVVPRCPVCKKRVRGPNHDESVYHKAKLNAKGAAA